MIDSAALQIERNKLIKEWARYTAINLQESLFDKKIGVTGSLSRSITYALIAAGGGDLSGTKHEFNHYGKFVDMGVGRGQKLESVKSNGEIISLVGGGRRPKKWFSKKYFGEVAKLRDLLMTKYGEDFQELVKESIQII